MENLLDFFRKQMAAFEGAANPSKAIASGYYIPEPGKSVSDLIAGRIALRPASTHLILGGIGSGKTTQLLMTLKKIDEMLP
jgi:type IV secretory pathway ATPase VirB11/archaellum biosynthesis ATPase